jgi:tripartite-type tricarboxylate transporter receptor subunit TctC
MSSLRTLSWPLLLGLLVLSPAALRAQDFPYKVVRIVTGGGGDDFMARVIAQGISGPLGQPVVVDNRATAIAPELVAKSSADGYTLLVSSSQLWLAPLMQDGISWNAVRDFSPITLIESSPNVLVVQPSLPLNTTRDLIAMAKAKPRQLNYSTGTTGGAAQLAGELFKAMAGVDIVRVPYKNGGLAVNALLASEVHLTFAGAGSLSAYLKSGKLKALAVTSAQPSVLFPGVPAVAETLPGYSAGSITVMVAPARTPAAVIGRLNQEIVRVLQRAELRDKFLADGVQVVTSTPEELAATIGSEVAKWGKLIRDVGIRVD